MFVNIQNHPFFVWVGAVFAIGAMVSVIYTCVQIVWYLDAQELLIEAEAEKNANWLVLDTEQFRMQNEFIDDIRQKQGLIQQELSLQGERLRGIRDLFQQQENRIDTGLGQLETGQKNLSSQLGFLGHSLGTHQGQHTILDIQKGFP